VSGDFMDTPSAVLSLLSAKFLGKLLKELMK